MIISVTDAARNLPIASTAHYQNVTFVLLKNGFPRCPASAGQVCTGRDLAEALAGTELPKEEAVAWHRDFETGRKTLKTLAKKWR